MYISAEAWLPCAAVGAPPMPLLSTVAVQMPGTSPDCWKGGRRLRSMNASVSPFMVLSKTQAQGPGLPELAGQAGGAELTRLPLRHPWSCTWPDWRPSIIRHAMPMMVSRRPTVWPEINRCIKKDPIAARLAELRVQPNKCCSKLRGLKYGSPEQLGLSCTRSL